MSLAEIKYKYQQQLEMALEQIRNPTKPGNWHSFAAIYQNILDDIELEEQKILKRIENLADEGVMSESMNEKIIANIKISELRGVIGNEFA